MSTVDLKTRCLGQRLINCYYNLLWDWQIVPYWGLWERLHDLDTLRQHYRCCQVNSAAFPQLMIGKPGVWLKNCDQVLNLKFFLIANWIQTIFSEEFGSQTYEYLKDNFWQSNIWIFERQCLVTFLVVKHVNIWCTILVRILRLKIQSSVQYISSIASDLSLPIKHYSISVLHSN